MTIRQIADRLNQVERIIEKDEKTNYHSLKYMKRIWIEQELLREKLYFECA